MDSRSIPDKYLPARIVDRRDVADDLFLLHVDPGAEFRYMAGQYATLGVEDSGKRIERAYSMSSSPYEPHLEFFVERVPEGRLSPLLHAMEKGTPLSLRRIAKGRFTLDLRSGRKDHLLLATVTGVAPYVSYIRTIFADWKRGSEFMPGDNRFFCIHAASRDWEFGYREELERYAAEAPWFTYIPSVSRHWESSAWTGERGRVDDLIRLYVEKWGLKPAETSAYLCGHPDMIENGRGILLRAGWDKTAILDEAYFQTESRLAPPGIEPKSSA